LTAEEIARLVVKVQEKGIDQTLAKLAALEKQGQKTAHATDSVDRKFSNLDKTVGDFNRTMTGMRNVVSLVRFPALIAGAGMATQAVGALGAGAVALTSALGPLAGLGAAGGAGLTALAQGGIVLKSAFGPVIEAVKGGDKEIAKLTGSAHAMAQELVVLQANLGTVASAAQDTMFPGVIRGLKDAQALLPTVRSLFADTGRVIGDMAARAGKMLGSKEWIADIGTVGESNTRVMRTMGFAGLALADAARHIVVAGGPLLEWISRMVLRGAEFVQAQAAAGRESGRLAGFLEKTRAVMTTLGNITGNLAVALWNIGKAAAPLGRDLLGQIEDLTKRFRDWTASVSGQNAIKRYFEQARDPILAIAGLIGDIGGAFLRLSQGEGATALVNQLRGLVPVLENVISSTTAAFGPALIDALGNVLRLFGQLAGSSGPLVVMVRLIGLIAGALADLLSSNPALNSMVVSFIGLYGVLKVTMLVLGPFAVAARAVEAALIGQTLATNMATAATVRERLAMVATAAAMYVQAAATKVVAAGQWLLNAAMTANPIALVVAALAALVAALIYAYTHSEKFRKIVDAAWSFLRNAAAVIFPAIAGFITGAWNVVQTVTTAVWGAIRAFLGGVWSGLRTLVTTYFNAYRTIVTTVWGAIQTVTTTVWNAIRTVVTGIWGGLRATATTVWDAIRSAILTPIRAARDVLETVWGSIRETASKAWEKIKDTAGTFAGNLKDTLVTAFKGAANAVIGFLNAIIRAINLIPGVPNIKAIEKLAQGGTFKAEGMANGGAFARTKGLIDKPMVFMGEEAPRHPEFVIPTNPAYRGRAHELLAKAAGALGFAQGGIFDAGALRALWIKAGGNPSLAGTMADVALAESGGNPNARNPSGASGLWQILGQLVPGNIFDPMVNALNAVAKFKLQGLHAWDASRSVWEKGGGILGGIGDLLGNVLGALPNPADLLPDWLQGTGKYVLDNVKDWAKDKVSDVLGPTVPSGGIPKGMAGSVRDAITLAMSMGFGYPSPGQLTGGTHEEGSLHYAGRAADFGDAGHTLNEMRALWAALLRKFGSHINELFYDVMPFYIDNFQKVVGQFGGHGDHIHIGFHKGGVFADLLERLPFGGSFGNGGVVPGPAGAPVAIVAHGGERVSTGTGDDALVRAINALTARLDAPNTDMHLLARAMLDLLLQEKLGVDAPARRLAGINTAGVVYP
jgi:phage-related protein